MTTADVARFKMDDEWHEVPEGVATFGELQGWAVDRFREEGRVLLGALHGEALVTQEEVAQWKGRPLRELETLEFLSAEPRALARRTCADMGPFLDRLADRADGAARHIERGEYAEALVGVRDCAEGWSLALQCFRDLLRLSGTDPSTVEMEGRSLTAVTNDLRGVIGKMSQEIQRSNMMIPPRS